MHRMFRVMLVLRIIIMSISSSWIMRMFGVFIMMRAMFMIMCCIPRGRLLVLRVVRLSCRWLIVCRRVSYSSFSSYASSYSSYLSVVFRHHRRRPRVVRCLLRSYSSSLSSSYYSA